MLCQTRLSTVNAQWIVEVPFFVGGSLDWKGDTGVCWKWEDHIDEVSLFVAGSLDVRCQCRVGEVSWDASGLNEIVF
jgi:hypothetical protein